MSAPTGTHPHDFYVDAEAEFSCRAAYRALLEDWPVPAVQRVVVTPVGPTFVLECGAPGGPPLVLLSGSVGTTASWLHEAEAWAPTHHLFLVDVPGEPGLSAGVRLPLETDAHARWLDAVLDALGLDRPGFVGISLGGWFALDYAIRHPARVARLVLLVPGGVGRQKSLLWLLPLLLLGRRGQDLITRRILGDPPAVLTGRQQAFVDFTKAVMRGFRGRRVRLPRFTDAALAGLAIPVMAIVAGRDVMLDGPETRRRLEATVADLELLWLPEARHFPGIRAEEIRAFLERTDPAARAPAPG